MGRHVQKTWVQTSFDNMWHYPRSLVPASWDDLGPEGYQAELACAPGSRPVNAVMHIQFDSSYPNRGIEHLVMGSVCTYCLAQSRR